MHGNNQLVETSNKKRKLILSHGKGKGGGLPRPQSFPSSFRLAPAHEALEDLEEEVHDRDPDEREADGRDIREDRGGIVAGRGLKIRNGLFDGRMDLSCGSADTIGEGAQRGRSGKSREHLLFHVCFFCLFVFYAPNQRV